MVKTSSPSEHLLQLVSATKALQAVRLIAYHPSTRMCSLPSRQVGSMFMSLFLIVYLLFISFFPQQTSFDGWSGCGYQRYPGRLDLGGNRSGQPAGTEGPTLTVKNGWIFRWILSPRFLVFFDVCTFFRQSITTAMINTISTSILKILCEKSSLQTVLFFFGGVSEPSPKQKFPNRAKNGSNKVRVASHQNDGRWLS